MNDPAITVEELVVHACYPLDGPAAIATYERIRELWQAWRPLLGRPIVGTDLPAHLPAALADLPADSAEETVIAGQESAAGDRQALIRRRHDVLHLSVAFAAHRYDESRARRRRHSAASWGTFDRQWQEMAGGADGLALGEARLHLATARSLSGSGSTDELTRAVLRRLPGPAAPDSPPAWASTASGLAAWEASPPVDTRALRRIVVLAPPDRDAELSSWTWSDGRPDSPPLARYLLNAAKLRHQLRVWNQGRDLATLRGRIASWVARLRSADSADDSDRAALRAIGLDTAAALAALAQLRRSVEIAADNMTRTLAGSGVVPGTGDLFDDDRELARWLLAQLDDETAYLAADRDLLRQVGEIVTREPAVRGPVTSAVHRDRNASDRVAMPTIGLLTAMPEEFHAMRTLLEQPAELPAPHDPARYTGGVLPSLDDDRPHQVVLVQTGDTAENAAADAATNMGRSFPTVECLLMVGIAAGAPAPTSPQVHVRLGDIVVASWGIVEYGHVVVRDGAVELRQPFPRPWPVLRRVASRLQADELRGERPWEGWLDVSGRPDLAGYARPPDHSDLLSAPYPGAPRPRHPARDRSGHRPGFPKVHHGLIGSASVSLRDGALRDALVAQHHLRAFEMEGAGVGNSAFLNDRHWFMVRGISDYADIGFGLRWRKYASLAAAAYVRALLNACGPVETSRSPGLPAS